METITILVQAEDKEYLKSQAERYRLELAPYCRMILLTNVEVSSSGD